MDRRLHVLLLTGLALAGVAGADAGAAAADGDTVRAAIETRMGDDVSDRTRIATGVAALLAATPAAPEETFFVVRRFLAALAVERPVVLLIDDLQWAEPLLLDLVEHLSFDQCQLIPAPRAAEGPGRDIAGRF